MFKEISRFHPGRVLNLVLLCVTGGLFFTCQAGWEMQNPLLPVQIPAQPLAQAGLLDLSGWDFSRYGSVKLDGQWELYWQQLYTPVHFTRATPAALVSPLYVPVPASWTTYRTAFSPLPGPGYATYRLRVRLKERREQADESGLAVAEAGTRSKFLAFKLLEMYTAYRLWVNGRLVAGNGAVGTGSDDTLPQFLPQVVAFEPESPDLEILVQVSNFCFSKSGISRSILLGELSSLQRLREENKAYHLFFTGAILMVGLYHLGLFWLGRKEKALLFFGSFCLVIMFRNFFIGERIIYELFPAFDWSLGLKLELLPIFLGPILFLLFIEALYPRETKFPALLVFIALEAAGILALALIPTLYIDYLFYINIGIIVAVCSYIVYTLVRAAMSRRPGAKILAAGFLVFFVSIVNDILYAEGLLATNHYIGLGLAFFILAEVAINEKFVRAEEQLRVQHEQLVHADKLVALGTLVASVAHEVNNPNNVIKINIDGALEDAKTLHTLLEEHVSDKESLQLGALSYQEFKNNFDAALQAIRKSAENIRQIVADLKTYAQKEKEEPFSRFDLSELIQEVIRLMAPFIRAATNRFSVNLAAGLPPFHGQPQRLKQVLVNLLQNACQALENKQQGIILATAYDSATGKMVLSVQDEGVGMDKETQQRMFEPFFTRKQTKGGTGLGLSITRQIVAAHGGEIKFDSQPGKGTTVRLIFTAGQDRESPVRTGRDEK